MNAAIWYGWPMNKRQALAAAKRAGINPNRVSNLENTKTWLFTHAPDQCLGEQCTIHNRSDHVMRKFPQWWRSDRGIMERTCPHGVGHPDPDSPWPTDSYEWVHGCDGCCEPGSPLYQANYGFHAMESSNRKEESDGVSY